MKVTATLAWWDERPEDLEACVLGTAEIADRIVAFDGAYRRYPGATPASDPEQAEIIRSTADEMGMECEVYVPDQLWAGQVAKRTALLQRAAEGSDWLVVVDSDHVVHANRTRARAELESYLSRDIDVVSVPFLTPIANDGLRYATNWHREIAGRTFHLNHIFRALPGFHVERFHWMYHAIKDGRPVAMMYGDDGRTDNVLLPHSLSAPYLVEHRCLMRDEEHIRANRAFCNDRVKVVAMTGQEDDISGLPPPVFDYDTIPY